MSHKPSGTEFGVGDQAARDFAASLGGVDSLVDAFPIDSFPAVILAPVWRAMLAASVVVAPPRVAVDRVEVVLVDANVLELRVPVSTTFGQLVKSVPVYIDQLAEGDLATQIANEANRLAAALEVADANPHFADGTDQKPHN
jgi:hypothetical protein